MEVGLSSVLRKSEKYKFFRFCVTVSGAISRFSTPLSAMCVCVCVFDCYLSKLGDVKQELFVKLYAHPLKPVYCTIIFDKEVGTAHWFPHSNVTESRTNNQISSSNDAECIYLFKSNSSAVSKNAVLLMVFK